MPDQPLVTSIDIINLSHSLKDICEVNCNTPECLNQTLKLLLQYNLIKLNLIFNKQLDCIDPCICGPADCKAPDRRRQPECKEPPRNRQPEHKGPLRPGHPDSADFSRSGLPNRKQAPNSAQFRSEQLNQEELAEIGLLDYDVISGPERLGLEELALHDESGLD